MNSKSKNTFNISLYLLLAASIIIFFIAAKFGVGLLSEQPHVAVKMSIFALCVAGVFMGARGSNISVRLAGFVLIPAVLGVFSARWLMSLEHSAVTEAGLVTLLCVGVSILISVFCQDLLKRTENTMSFLPIALYAVSIVIDNVFKKHFIFIDYTFVMVFVVWVGGFISKSREVDQTLKANIGTSCGVLLSVLGMFACVIPILS